MGSRLSRRVAGVENIDIQTNYNYHFPPKTGNYFSSHFFIAGERFDTPHPDGYLFGENTELKFLGNRPVQFPYLTPAPKEPVQTLRSLVNIRKDSLRLVRYKDGPDGPTGPVYGVEFIFDADAEVAITVCCQAREELTSGMPVYSPNSPTFLAETVLYRRGVNQQFSHPSFRIDFTQWTPEELHFDLDRGLFPMVLQAVVDGAESSGHAHVMLAAFDRNVDGSFSVKPLKQKQIVDGVTYLLQEIYGIENRTSLETKMEDEETSGKSSECVVCLADLRDTLILPCRHLCLCSVCADTLRYQANSCPICRLREWYIHTHHTHSPHTHTHTQTIHTHHTHIHTYTHTNHTHIHTLTTNTHTHHIYTLTTHTYTHSPHTTRHIYTLTTHTTHTTHIHHCFVTDAHPASNHPCTSVGVRREILFLWEHSRVQSVALLSSPLCSRSTLRQLPVNTTCKT
uniref:E3 ubiquitin-protein ligase n=1 Tax=Denticeps clupeoides TaxID=299321 RepID=A0AAY4ATE1_9TELE